MPQMADITVKKADNTTDVVYVAQAPSSGDGVPAVWRVDAGFTHAMAKPVFQISSRSNGQKTARRVEFTFVLPQTYTESTTNLVKVQNKVPISGSFVLPLEVPDSIVAEAVHQLTNLLSSTLVRNSLKAGFAPT